MDDFQPQLTQQALEVHVRDEPLHIWGDELRLEQVLQNLLSNASKYSPTASVISVDVERRGDRVALSVRDQGIGIPDNMRTNIFHRFYRADNVDSQQITGLGIGLYVVKEIVTRHEGTVDVTSREGSGSTFTVDLPLSRNLLANKEPAEPTG